MKATVEIVMLMAAEAIIVMAAILTVLACSVLVNWN